MLKRLKKIDDFSRNIIIVFAGTSLVNFFNLLYQLLIAHRLTLSEFSSFNSLLSIFMLISAPLGTIQMSVAKYSADFKARNLDAKIKALLSGLLKKASIMAVFTVLIFSVTYGYIMDMLKIQSILSGYILALLVASSWLLPVFLGGIQGLELFGWQSVTSVLTGALKLALSFIFILLGYNISGALGALLATNVVCLFIFYFPLKRYISLRPVQEAVNYKEVSGYLFPVAISNMCFIALVSFDMVLVRHFFLPFDSGIYSLAQMVGKIFLFLPGAVSMVMFPRASGLKAKNMDTSATLTRSLVYVLCLCVFAVFIYNLFPSFVLTVLTGKAYPESITLGRLFSISMTFFTLLFILISYFLSIKDLRFIKYLVLFTLLQVAGVNLFHRSLIQVQLVLCINAVVLFFIHLVLACKKQAVPLSGAVSA